MVGAAAAALFAAATATAAPPTAIAAAPSLNASAEVGTHGLKYTGLDGPNKVTVTLSNSRFVISNIAPISAGPGCVTTKVGAGLFGVECQAPKTTSGAFRSFQVTQGGGNDVVTNDTAIGVRANGAPATTC